MYNINLSMYSSLSDLRTKENRVSVCGVPHPSLGWPSWSSLPRSCPPCCCCPVWTLPPRPRARCSAAWGTRESDSPAVRESITGVHHNTNTLPSRLSRSRMEGGHLDTRPPCTFATVKLNFILFSEATQSECF